MLDAIAWSITSFDSQDAAYPSRSVIPETRAFVERENHAPFIPKRSGLIRKAGPYQVAREVREEAGVPIDPASVRSSPAGLATRPHLHRDWARPRPHLHRESGTALVLGTPAPGLRSLLATPSPVLVQMCGRSWPQPLFACGYCGTNDRGADTIARSLGLSAAATPASSCSAARRALAPTRSCSMHARWRMCASLATAWRLSARRMARMVLRGAHAPHLEEIAAAWLGLGTVPLRVHSREP